MVLGKGVKDNRAHILAEGGRGSQDGGRWSRGADASVNDFSASLGTPISRSPLDKNPMPGHLSELQPVNAVNTKGQ